MKNQKKKALYRAKELAELLCVSEPTVWRWRREGKIKSVRLSKGVTVFPIEEVLKDLNLAS